MKTKTITFLLSLVIFSNLITEASEVWITPVGADGTGAGTAANPYVTSSSSGATFDALLPTIPSGSTIHLMAGTFATEGHDEIPPGCKLRGAGLDVTTIQMETNFQGFASRFSGIDPASIGQNYPLLWSSGDGTEVSDLTLDCNVQNQSYSWLDGTTNWSGICIDAVQLSGNNVKLSRAKAINWGTTTTGVECFIFIAGGVGITNVLIEDCIVQQPAQVTFLQGADGFICGGATGAEIRNCRIYDIPESGTGAPQYFNGIGIGDVVGVKVDGNMLINAAGTGVGSSCNSISDCSIENNMFINVDTGVGFAASDYCPGGTNSVKENIVIGNNIIVVTTGGMGISMSGIFGQPITNLTIVGNTVQAADGAGGITALGVATSQNVTIRNNTLDANGGSTFVIGTNAQIAQLVGNQNLAGATLVPSGWIATNLSAVFVDSAGNITLSPNLTVDGSISEVAGQAYMYDSINMAFGLTGLYDYFFGGAGNFTTTGIQDTAVGFQAFASNTTGYGDTAIGWQALWQNTTGFFNVANGRSALLENTTGSYNLADGVDALYYNTNGSYNIANGDVALFNNTSGYCNVANGAQAAFSDTTGSGNTVNGFDALYYNTTGNNNTADGNSALSLSTVGSYNIALGFSAGYNITNGSYNIDIGNNGLAADNGIIRIGSANQTDTYMAGVVHMPTNVIVGGTNSASYYSGNGGGLTNLSFPSHPLLFAVLTNTLTISNSVNQRIWFDTVLSSNNISYSTNSGFVINATGVYQVSATIAWQGVTSNVAGVLWLVKNGIDYLRVQINPSQNTSLTLTATIPLNAGDTVDFQVWQNAGSTVQIAGNTTPNYQSFMSFWQIQ